MAFADRSTSQSVQIGFTRNPRLRRHFDSAPSGQSLSGRYRQWTVEPHWSKYASLVSVLSVTYG